MIVFIVHPSLRLHEFQYKRCRQNIADQCFNNGEKTSDSDRGDVTVTNGEQCNSTKVYRMQVDVFGSIVHSIYFSGVTLLTIGYGDITRIGIGRFLAIVEALIGYILPTAFVLKLVQSQGRMDDKNDHDKQ